MYIVMEVQTYEDGTIGNIVTTFDDFNQALSKYHTILAAAAISNLPCHAAAIMSNECDVYENSSFKHGE